MISNFRNFHFVNERGSPFYRGVEHERSVAGIGEREVMSYDFVKLRAYAGGLSDPEWRRQSIGVRQREGASGCYRRWLRR